MAKKMIQYRFKIGITEYPAWFENDEQAKAFSEFIGATFERDTCIFKYDYNDFSCKFEVDLSQIKDIKTFKIKNLQIWQK
jgi:hypothetical protein